MVTYRNMNRYVHTLVDQTSNFFDPCTNVKVYYIPPTWRVRGYIVFGADPVDVGVHFFVSVHYLLNQLMDFDQTSIYTLFGGGKELIRFW